jgi:hypothetical protein
LAPFSLPTCFSFSFSPSFVLVSIPLSDHKSLSSVQEEVYQTMKATISQAVVSF